MGGIATHVRIVLPVFGNPIIKATCVTVARHPVELGHRRIAVISGPTDFLCARARLEACRATLDTAGVPLNDRLVRSSHFQFEDGLRLAQELLAPAQPPTAIACGNDLQALGVYEAARRAGATHPPRSQRGRFRRHPRRRLVRTRVDHGAATVRRHGRNGCLHSAVARGRQTPTQPRMELGTTLVVRDSTAPPRPVRPRKT
jgi:LacI family xylobiose transport system transcriptional regulator